MPLLAWLTGIRYVTRLIASDFAGPSPPLAMILIESQRSFTDALIASMQATCQLKHGDIQPARQHRHRGRADRGRCRTSAARRLMLMWCVEILKNSPCGLCEERRRAAKPAAPCPPARVRPSSLTCASDLAALLPSCSRSVSRHWVARLNTAVDESGGGRALLRRSMRRAVFRAGGHVARAYARSPATKPSDEISGSQLLSHAAISRAAQSTSWLTRATVRPGSAASAGIFGVGPIQRRLVAVALSR